jgi:hypothetical protein
MRNSRWYNITGAEFDVIPPPKEELANQQHLGARLKCKIVEDAWIESEPMLNG